MHVTQGAGGAVEEGLGPQHQDVRVGRGLGGQVFARAEAQFEPDAGGARLQGLQIERPRRQVEAQLGQQRVHQAGATGPQAAAPDAAIGAQTLGRIGGHGAPIAGSRAATSLA